MHPVTELSLKKWEHPPQCRGWSWQDWAFLGDIPPAQMSFVTTGALIQETHPALGMEKLMWVYEAAGWYNLSRKPGRLLYLIIQIISKPSQAGCGVCEYLLWVCASILKISSLKKRGANAQQTFWFLSGRLQSAGQWIAVVHTGSLLGLKMCRGVSGMSRLTGGENKKACWFSKLISVNRGAAVMSQFKTHAALK